MAELNSAFSGDDIETLIEAMDDWESVGNHEYIAMQMVKNHPMPEEEEESFEFIRNIKDHFRKRETEIKKERKARQQKAVFTKAKLMLLREEAGSLVVSPVVDVSVHSPEMGAPSQAKRLELAEFYIRDLGVGDMYEKFLSENGFAGSQEDTAQDDGWFHSGQ